MENKKQAIILSGVAIVALLALIIGATYAYFRASGNSSSSTNVNVTTYTSDLLTFEIGNDIAVYADQTSFASGKGNATGSTFAKAILTANNKTNTATKNYYVYLNISENTFTYTQNESTPELLLTIKDTSGNEITSITGLTHKTVTDGKGASISGFDITTKSGVITLFDNREITANPTKTEEWNITVTFVNYNANQTGNAGKSFNAKLIIQQESQSNQTLADYVISQYTGTQGDNALYYHNSTLTNGAGDNSYRYAGASDSVNNYICLGSDATTCPDANLFRIIGVFGDKTKVIRAKSVGDKEWGTNNSNTWSSSSLNTYLNGEYLTSLGTLADKIATTTWKVGGGSATYLYDVPTTAYQYEVGSSASTTTYDAKIGLMYVSDYGFAASPSAWTTTLNNYDVNDAKGTSIKTINWMYMGYYDWMISRISAYSDDAFLVVSVGRVSSRSVSGYFGVRPSFNLSSSITYVSGSGSMSDPILIN